MSKLIYSAFFDSLCLCSLEFCSADQINYQESFISEKVFYTTLSHKLGILTAPNLRGSMIHGSFPSSPKDIFEVEPVYLSCSKNIQEKNEADD